MKRVGAYEAKTRLLGLLKEVSRGAKICITRRGVPVATLEPMYPDEKPDPHRIIRGIRDFRKGIFLNGVSIRETVEGGRRS